MIFASGGGPEEEEEDIVDDDLPDLTRRCINVRRQVNALLVTAAAQWSARRIPRSSRESHCRSGPRLGFFLPLMHGEETAITRRGGGPHRGRKSMDTTTRSRLKMASDF
jgi:hypothetical protein